MGTSGYQFIHIEGFARKADAKGRSVAFVISEAERRVDACAHVPLPRSPELVFGLSLADLRASHDNQAASATATIAGGKTRKIRQDQITLMTFVASHPATIDEVRDNPAVAAKVADWELRVVAWLRQQWGDDLASVVRHVDERHAHLHAFILPSDAEMRARRLHPGLAEKEIAKTAAMAEGANAKTANAAGDKAYRGAMRAMQDSFWHSVGIPCGLARIGPARRRLSRAGWHAEKAAVAAAAEALQVADTARAEVASARQDAAIVAADAEAQKVAAESLQARATDAARRAQVAIYAARDRAAEAKVAADAALAERVKAERQARLLAAQGRRFIEQARGEARRMLGSARAEAERVRRSACGLGAWIGAVVHGLRGVAPSKVAREAAATARAEEQAVATARITLFCVDAERTQRELRLTEGRLASVSEAAARLGAQRDRLAHELNRLRPEEPRMAPTPHPR